MKRLALFILTLLFFATLPGEEIDPLTCGQKKESFSSLLYMKNGGGIYQCWLPIPLISSGAGGRIRKGYHAVDLSYTAYVCPYDVKLNFQSGSIKYLFYPNSFLYTGLGTSYGDFPDYWENSWSVDVVFGIENNAFCGLKSFWQFDVFRSLRQREEEIFYFSFSYGLGF